MEPARKLYLIGASLEVIELAEATGFEVVGVVDENLEDQDYFGYPIPGDDTWLLNCDEPQTRDVVIPFDDASVKRHLFRAYRGAGFNPVSLIGADAGRLTMFGRGCLVQTTANISTNCTIGEGVKINSMANVMHDCTIGDFSTIAPNAVLLGYVTVEADVFIGANATVLPRVRIGQGATIGAGAVVTANVDAGRTVKGVPAR